MPKYYSTYIVAIIYTCNDFNARWKKEKTSKYGMFLFLVTSLQIKTSENQLPTWSNLTYQQLNWTKQIYV